MKNSNSGAKIQQRGNNNTYLSYFTVNNKDQNKRGQVRIVTNMCHQIEVQTLTLCKREFS